MANLYVDPSKVTVSGYIKDPDTGEVILEYETDGTLKSVSASIVKETTNRQFVSNSEKYLLALLSANNVMLTKNYDSDENGIVDKAEIALSLDINSSQAKTWDLKQDALGYTPENLANKGKANGYVPLNSDSKIDNEYLYNISWETIENKPISSIDEIDDTVSKKHSHSNKNALDYLDVNSSGLPIWNEALWPYIGNMTKEVYDIDDDGVVDVAKTAYSITWSGIKNGPTSLVNNIDDAVNKRHYHNNLEALEFISKDDNDLPLWNNLKWPYDMKKSVYDTDNDGIIDLATRAKSVEWSGIINKPESEVEDIDLAVQNTHKHDNLEALDVININNDQNRLTFKGKELAFSEDLNDQIIIDGNSLTTRFSVGIDNESRSIQLVNDLMFPEALMYYGTDSNQNRGFHKLPNIKYLESGSIKIDALNRVSLENDATEPGQMMYYGTNNNGEKGYFEFPEIEIDYTLPSEIDASIIKQDDEHRFVTKEDIDKLNTITDQDLERIKIIKGNVIGNGCRQCIVSKSNNMFTIDGSDLIIKASENDPITLSFSNGKYVEIIKQLTENLTLTNIPSIINSGTAYIYLYIDNEDNKKIKVNKSLYKPIYSYTKPNAINEGQYWFNISNYTMNISTGYTYIECENPTLFVGEISAANGIVNYLTYAANGYYDSKWYEVTYGTTYNKNHNIGTDLVSVTAYRGLNGNNLGEFAFAVHGGNTISDTTPLGDRISKITDTYIRTTRYNRPQSTDTVYEGSNQHRVIVKRLW